MSKQKEKMRKNPNRDDFGMVGNIAWETQFLLPKVAQKHSSVNRIQANNPSSGVWTKMNENPP